MAWSLVAVTRDFSGFRRGRISCWLGPLPTVFHPTPQPVTLVNNVPPALPFLWPGSTGAIPSDRRAVCAVRCRTIRPSPGR
jgi:hypothetical protein